MSEPPAARPSIWHRLGRCLPFLRPHRARVALILVATVIAAVLPALEPLGMRAIFERLTSARRAHQAASQLTVPVACLFALWSSRYGLDLVSSLLAWRVRLRVQRDLLARAAERLPALPLAYHQDRGVGETMTRLDRGVGTLMEGLAQLCFQAIPALVYVAFSLAIMVHLSPPLTLLAAAFILPPALLGHLGAKKLVAKERDGLDRWCSIHDRLRQVLTGIRVVKAFGREDDEHRRFCRGVDAAQHDALGSQSVGARLGNARAFWGNAGRVAVIGAGALLVLHGRIGSGILIAFMGYVAGLYGPAQALLGLYETLRKAELGLDAVFGVLDAEDPLPDPPAPRAVPKLRGAIELDRVTFRHPGAARPALAGLSLSIAPGETVAVVGASGAGKSTLLDMILRFHDPSAGAVRIDGLDLRALPQRALRARLGLVTQEPFLFDDTIAENLRYARPDASLDQIRRVARAARCDRFIERLPRGYDTRLGPGGVQLSGGERQRLAIARTLLHDPDVVLLDEPTGCLDVESELEVQAAVERLAAGRTTVLVAHRLAATARADRVLVMDEGRIVEEGPPGVLLRRPHSRYRRMMRLFQGAVPRLAETPLPIAV